MGSEQKKRWQHQLEFFMFVHCPEMTRAERGKEQRRRKINGLCQLNTFINCALGGTVQSLDSILALFFFERPGKIVLELSLMRIES